MVDGDLDARAIERGTAMSDKAFDKAFGTMAGSAHQSPAPAFDDLGASAAAEVQGHLIGSDAFSDDAAFGPTGAAAAIDDEAAEVEGHASRRGSEHVAEPANAAAARDDEAPEVEGHVHPIQMPDYTHSRAADIDAAAARALRAREARSGRDGGIVDKVLRRKSK